jgi:hypothetical protein
VSFHSVVDPALGKEAGVAKRQRLLGGESDHPQECPAGAA